jgi:hypothetical protein
MAIKSVYVTCTAKEVAYPIWPTSIKCRQVWIQAKRDNDGYLMVGDDTISQLDGIELIKPVASAHSHILHIDGGPQNGLDLSAIYVLASADGDIANVMYEEF